MRRSGVALAVVLSMGVAAPAAAQLHAGDSLAVIRLVQRYHAALEAGDTAAVKGMLAAGAMVVHGAEVSPLTGEDLARVIRWDRAIIRVPATVTARVLGSGAYVSMVSKFSARAAPDAIRGDEVESIFLSRLGDAWSIELVHLTVGSPP